MTEARRARFAGSLSNIKTDPPDAESELTSRPIQNVHTMSADVCLDNDPAVVAHLAAEFDASSLATGAYDYLVVVRSYRSDGSFRETDMLPVRILIANEVNSPFGAGWSIAGTTITLVGSTCARVQSGEALDVRIIVGCPTIAPH